jgi:hypothetical protein
MLIREITGDYSGSHTKCTNAVCGQTQIFECADCAHCDHWTALLLWCDSSCANIMALLSGAETSRLYWWPLRPGRPRNHRLIRSRCEIFLFSKVPKAALEPTDPPCQWVRGVKRPGLEADHLPESSAGVNQRLELYRRLLSWLAKGQRCLYPHCHDTMSKTLMW